MKTVTPRECARILASHSALAILVHANPDGDCIGSGAALSLALLGAGKAVRLCCTHPLPDRLSFLCKALPEDVLCFGRLFEEAFAPDLVLSVDVASPELLGPLYAPFAKEIGLCVDHHKINTVSADAILRRDTAAAAGEIVLEIADALGELCGKSLLTKDVCDCLFAAISSDSGSFKYGNTTAQTLLYASRLKSLGADSERISRLLFDTKSAAQFRLTGMLIPKTRFFASGKVAYCLLTQEDMKTCGAGREDVEGIAQLFREVEGVEVSVFARETEEGAYKMSLRANGEIDVAAVCRAFGGGGHSKAAGCTLAGMSAEEAEKQVLDAVMREGADVLSGKTREES